MLGISVLVTCAADGTRAGPVGMWKGSIGGLPNNKLASVPTLGNGYLGVLLGTDKVPPPPPHTHNTHISIPLVCVGLFVAEQALTH
jgi:hypothetical protein